KPCLGIANMGVRLRIGVATPHTQIGADDNHPPCRFALR
ncbi:MAG: hypothetical protein JWP84_3020, partial [Tardiphaga sp.]|nr:hypothetical protein [Tardiphaga sp.]